MHFKPYYPSLINCLHECSAGEIKKKRINVFFFSAHICTGWFFFYSPLMTGVNTAIPSKFGLLTVLSRIKPPILGKKKRHDTCELHLLDSYTEKEVTQ